MQLLLPMIVLLLQTSPGELNRKHYAAAGNETISGGCEPCLRVSRALTASVAGCMLTSLSNHILLLCRPLGKAHLQRLQQQRRDEGLASKTRQNYDAYMRVFMVSAA
jgi:hypothetical protein